MPEVKPQRRQYPDSYLLSSIDLSYLKPVYEPGYGTYASADRNFRSAFFSRDAMVVDQHLRSSGMRDLYRFVARDNILTALTFQGAEYQRMAPGYYAREESPGNLAHEVRFARDFDGNLLPRNVRKILRGLSRNWGGDPNSLLRYYGAKDTAPLGADGIASFVDDFGADFLNYRYSRYDGNEMTVLDGLAAALGWTERNLRLFDNGFLENVRTNEVGHLNPWRADSWIAYVHPNGELANAHAPKASVDQGGYIYDALTKGSKILSKSDNPHYKYQAERLMALAPQVQHAHTQELWMDDIDYPAMGFDRDPETGERRSIKTVTVLPLINLRSTLYDDMHPDDQRKYIEGMLRIACSEEMLTEVGLRSRSTRHGNIFGFPDYWGHLNSWGVITIDTAIGFDNQGMHRLAEQMYTRFLNGVRRAGVNREFFPILEDGTVITRPKRSSTRGDAIVRSGSYPEGNQAWTASGRILAEKRMAETGKYQSDTDSWRYETESRILEMVPHEHLLSPDEIKQKVQSEPIVVLDPHAGGGVDREILVKAGFPVFTK